MDTELHPMANAGAETWDKWCGDMLTSNWAEYKAVRDKMRLSLASNYEALTAADRSAFAYSLADAIAWAAKGLATKKKGRKR